MVESSWDDLIKGIFTGVTEWGMADVMSQGNSLCQIFIEVQGFGDRPGNLGNLKGMG
jgi:hypothetical protein